MASLWYFINDILFTSEQGKVTYTPSLFLYYLPFLILEILSIICIIIYAFPQLPQQPSLFTILLFIICFILVTCIISLCLDLFGRTTMSILADFHQCLYYDFHYNSAQYGEDSMYFQRIYAYQTSLRFDNSMCVICQHEYVDDNMVYDKSLISCGHLHHKQCLMNNERYQWNNNLHKYSLSQCPHCRHEYHAHSQKFDFDPNYFQKLPFYLRDFDYFGRETLNMLYWDVIDQEYMKYRGQDLSERPFLFGSQINCMIAIILNICNLGIQLIWKCIKFAWKSMKYIISTISRFFNPFESLKFGMRHVIDVVII